MHYAIYGCKLLLKIVIFRRKMNCPPTKSTVKTVSEVVEKKPIVSHLEKTFRKINNSNSKTTFGIFDRRTLEICACYKDSVKYSILALIGAFIGVVNTLL